VTVSPPSRFLVIFRLALPAFIPIRFPSPVFGRGVRGEGVVSFPTNCYTLNCQLAIFDEPGDPSAKMDFLEERIGI
jgi:hypothetical protein